MDIDKLNIKSIRCDDCIIIKIPKVLKEKLAEKARNNYTNLSQYVRNIIVEDILKDENKS